MNRPRLFMPLLTLAFLAQTASAAIAADAAPAEQPVLAAADFKLADHAGRVVVLDFWASWCKPCKLAMPWLSRMQHQYGEQGLQVVAVSVDTDEKAMRARLGEMDPGIVVVFDPKGELAAQYKLEGMPTTYLIDRKGTLVASHVGYREADAAKHEAELKAMLQVDKLQEDKLQEDK